MKFYDVYVNCVLISSGVEKNGMITVFTWLCVMFGDVD